MTHPNMDDEMRTERNFEGPHIEIAICRKWGFIHIYIYIIFRYILKIVHID